eukprot:CAMPEP_0169292548 /NCGR_PEP_ID=MMETSP1016-20121227/62814_1 /TAXON_ID=342587 /ORGANISM="Karlodinium micrum, Strain CCMP2283" /LENGTH=397 /DNA_ID=CAMNT_0009383177 /DNA_START=61 /DNA_END=1252 /DNA_ORIENTATION=-
MPLRPKWKATLIEMGFPLEQVELAVHNCTTLRGAVERMCSHELHPTDSSGHLKAEGSMSSKQKEPSRQSRRKVVGVRPDLKENKSQKRIQSNTDLCTTLRRAVEWLCLQEAGNIAAPMDQSVGEPANQAEAFKDDQVQLEPSEVNVAHAPSESKRHKNNDSDQLKLLTQESTSASPESKRNVEVAKPMCSFTGSEIATPQRVRSNVNVVPSEVESSGDAAESKEQIKTSTQPKTMQPMISNRRFSASGSSAMWPVPSPGSASRRTSLGSLLTVPAESWSADQLQAALRQLHSFGAQPRKPVVFAIARKRLRFKQSLASDDFKSPLHKQSAHRSKTIRLRFKQSVPSYFVPQISASSREAPTAAEMKVGKVPKTFAKWSTVLLDMGFPADQVNSNLRK